MKKEKIQVENLTFISVAILVVLVWFFLPLYLDYVFKYDDTFDLKGKFGDMYNVATSLFGAITIILLLYNTYLTRKELKDNRIEFKIQNSTLIHQRFENTFFQLLKVHSDNVNNIDLVGTKETLGRDCFKLFNEGIKKIYIQERRSRLYNPKSDAGVSAEMFEKLEDEIAAYDKYFSRAKSDLGHYFKTLYRIVRFIDEANHFSDAESPVMDQKKFYTGILRSQLSTYEEILIAYNALGKYGNKFKLLIQKYDLLKNCDYSQMENGELIKLKIEQTNS